MRTGYLIYGVAVIAAFTSVVQAGRDPFSVSSEKATAKPVSAGVGAGRPRGSSTFIWLGGYGGK